MLHAGGKWKLQHACTRGWWRDRAQQRAWAGLGVAIGAPEVLPDFKGPAKSQEGFNFCLFNNAWGTNYVQWTPYGRKHGKRNKFRCAACADVCHLPIAPNCVHVRCLTWLGPAGHPIVLDSTSRKECLRCNMSNVTNLLWMPGVRRLRSVL
jgi:hypothetical protein